MLIEQLGVKDNEDHFKYEQSILLAKTESWFVHFKHELISLSSHS